ncbi:MAG: hypothetical protein RLZZ367_1681 [Bacteroidota bacterium]|jgi:hypothetical protein
MRADFIFAAGDCLDITVFNSVETFIECYPDSQTVVLADENELDVLLNLIGVNRGLGCVLNNTDFTVYWDISGYKLPELSDNQFDAFYEPWIKATGRPNNMDEYGALIFLQGLTKKWNSLKYRFVVRIK